MRLYTHSGYKDSLGDAFYPVGDKASPNESFTHCVCKDLLGDALIQ